MFFVVGGEKKKSTDPVLSFDPNFQRDVLQCGGLVTTLIDPLDNGAFPRIEVHLDTRRWNTFHFCCSDLDPWLSGLLKSVPGFFGGAMNGARGDLFPY